MSRQIKYGIDFKKSVVEKVINGNCGCKAVAKEFALEHGIENFFGTLKSEMFYLKKYESIAELNKDITEYIEYYNNDRIRLNLNGMSPVQYRAHSQKS